MRTRYLGPGWDLAKVRGTRFNTGGGIKMALDIGAMPYGNWSGCHAVGWDYNAPEFGDLAVGDNFQKHSYPFAIMVNADGVRFCDEGADFRNYTYAKYGRLILEQPHQFAWQIFDQQVVHLQRDEYRIRQVTKVTADTIEELADKMAEYAPVDKPRFLANDPRVQRRGAARHPLQPDGQGRPHHQGSRDRQDQLGDADRKAALRGLLHDLRRHLHLWRVAHRYRRQGARHRAKADPRPLCGGRTGRRAVLFQLSGRHRARFGLGFWQDRRHHRRRGGAPAIVSMCSRRRRKSGAAGTSIRDTRHGANAGHSPTHNDANKDDDDATTTRVAPQQCQEYPFHQHRASAGWEKVAEPIAKAASVARTNFLIALPPRCLSPNGITRRQIDYSP